MVFKTFACDNSVVEGENYLRADYSLSCDSDLHMFFEVYAGIMILVSKPAFMSSVRRHVVRGVSSAMINR